MLRPLLHAFAGTLLALLLGGCATQPSAPQEPLKLQLLAINDFHGNLLPPAPYRMPNPARPGETISVPVGGAEALATAVKQRRAGQTHHAFVAAGDLIGASPLLSALFNDEVTIESLSRMGLQLSAVGNHEFDRGAAELLRRQQGGCAQPEGCKGPEAFTGARFQYLAASTVVEATGRTLLPPYAIRRYDGVAVGFIGLTLKGTPQLVMPSGVAGLRFDDEVETINRYTAELLAQGVNTVVVLIHEGGYPTGGANECPAISGAIVGIAERLHPAVGLVVSGHTHMAYVCRIGGRLVTSAHRYGTMLTDIELQIDRRSGKLLASRAENLLVRTDQYAKDPEQTALIAAHRPIARQLAERPVGRLGVELRNEADRAGRNPMGELIADAQLAATRDAGAEIALMGSCGIRTGLRLRDGGAIVFEDLFSAQPFGNQLVTVTLSGAELLDSLRRQFRGSGGCSRMQASASLSYAWDGRRDGADRLLADSVRVNGQALDLRRSYRVTINNFMHGGGDGFSEFAAGRDARTGPLDLDALEAFARSQSLLQPPADARVRRLD